MADIVYLTHWPRFRTSGSAFLAQYNLCCGALKNSGLLRNAVKLTHRSGAARYAASGTLQSNESNRGHWLSSHGLLEKPREQLVPRKLRVVEETNNLNFKATA